MAHYLVLTQQAPTDPKALEAAEADSKTATEVEPAEPSQQPAQHSNTGECLHHICAFAHQMCMH